MRLTRIQLEKLSFCLLIGFLFLLPHVVRIAEIGSFQAYSPFAAQTPSSTVWDETFMYAPQVNYTLEHGGLANDTDAFEHRNEPYPYSIIPTEVEASLARATGSLDAAQIFCHFLFPAISAWLLMTLMGWMGASVPLAALLSLVILVGGFSPRTVLIGDLDVLRHGLHGGFSETLQASRNPHPNMSFPLFLATAMAAVLTLCRKRTRYAVLAGLLGGMLFYTYVFYAISWAAACSLLAVLSFWKLSGISKHIRLTLVMNAVLGIPFLLWVRASKLSGAYWNRTYRMGLTQSHSLSKESIELSAAWLLVAAIVACWWFWGDGRRSRDRDASEVGQFQKASFLVFLSAVLGGVAGMNMQLVTGFNIQAVHHFPHMVIQPAILILLAAACIRWIQSALQGRSSDLRWSRALFIVLFAGCVVSQVDAGVHSGSYHRVSFSDQALFHWLDRNSTTSDVVATTNLRLCTLLPVYTKDFILLVNGSRTSGTDDEVMERFLLASALTETPASRVSAELRQTDSDASQTPLFSATYSYFMFENSPYFDSDRHRILEARIPAILEKYREIQANLPAELARFRVNYIYMQNKQAPASISGWNAAQVFEAPNGGELWKLWKD